MTIIDRLETAAQASTIRGPLRVATYWRMGGKFVCRIALPSEDGLSIRVIAETIPTEARYAEQARLDCELIVAAVNAAPALLVLARAMAMQRAAEAEIDAARAVPDLNVALAHQEIAQAEVGAAMALLSVAVPS